MNEASRLARRYHWHSATVRDFTSEPHTAIVGEHAGTIRNLVDRRARPAQDALLAIARDDPATTLAEVRTAGDAARITTCARPTSTLKRLGAVLALAHERDLRDFASFLLLEQLGPRTLQSLALVAEVVHGAPTRFADPARFSFAHGGKDGHPFPVPLKIYDESICGAAARARRREAWPLGTGSRACPGWTGSRAHWSSGSRRKQTCLPRSHTSGPSPPRWVAARCSTIRPTARGLAQGSSTCSSVIRGASPLGLRHTRPRSPPRRSAFRAKAGRSRGSLATLARAVSCRQFIGSF